jgi:hypothetical protein
MGDESQGETRKVKPMMAVAMTIRMKHVFVDDDEEYLHCMMMADSGFWNEQV